MADTKRKLTTGALILLALALVSVQANPDAKPKAKPQDPNYQYGDYNEYGEYGQDFYGN